MLQWFKNTLNQSYTVNLISIVHIVSYKHVFKNPVIEEAWVD